MTRNRVMLGLAGCGILLAGLMIGMLLNGGTSARAAVGGAVSPVSIVSTPPPNREKYCLLYIQTLASNLHVSVSQLQSASQSALRTTIQRAYSDGQITQAQETRLLNKVTRLGANPCAAMHYGGWGAGGLASQAARLPLTVVHSPPN